MNGARINHFRELVVYRKAFELAVTLFEISKKFPSEEQFGLTSQMRRASRSVCSNLAEGWRKRKYEAVFKNKLSDAMQEASEVQCWLEFALACGYLAQIQFDDYDKQYEEIIAMLNSMEMNSHKFCFPKNK